MIVNQITAQNTEYAQFERMLPIISSRIVDLATAALRRHGFYGINPVREGMPESFDAVVKAVDAGGKLFPVYAGDSDRSIYVSPAHNVMFRAWHDLSHYELGAGFDYQGEHKVALSHLWHFEEPLKRIIRADTLGQLNFYHFGPSGAFLHDQRAFVWDYLTMGETAAIMKHRSAQGLTVH